MILYSHHLEERLIFQIELSDNSANTIYETVLNVNKDNLCVAQSARNCFQLTKITQIGES